MAFQIEPLEAAQFSHLFDAQETALERAGALCYVADAKPGFPCRVSLEDAEPGARLLLINFEHQGARSPYRSSHAIFVREGAETAQVRPDHLPEMITTRQLSLRAFDSDGMMVDACVVEGSEAGPALERLLAFADTQDVHIHSAARGCYLAKAVRA